MALKGIVPHSESLYGNTTQVRKELTAARQLVKSCKKAIPQDQELSIRIFDPRKPLNTQIDEPEPAGGQGRRTSPRLEGPNGSTAGPRGSLARGSTVAVRLDLGRDLGEVWSLPAARYYHCMTITEMYSFVWLDVRGIRTQVNLTRQPGRLGDPWMVP